jgi:hypothetical protein
MRQEAVLRDLSARAQDTIATKHGFATAADTILRWYHALPPHHSAVREAV